MATARVIIVMNVESQNRLRWLRYVRVSLLKTRKKGFHFSHKCLTANKILADTTLIMP